MCCSDVVGVEEIEVITYIHINYSCVKIMATGGGKDIENPDMQMIAIIPPTCAECYRLQID